jgi:hypothetical protein
MGVSRVCSSSWGAFLVTNGACRGQRAFRHTLSRLGGWVAVSLGASLAGLAVVRAGVPPRRRTTAQGPSLDTDKQRSHTQVGDISPRCTHDVHKLSTRYPHFREIVRR